MPHLSRALRCTNSTVTRIMSTLLKTRFLIMSDTHNANRQGEQYRWEPFPKADVLLHCGDMTMVGRMQEFQTTFDMLKDARAELKLVIAGNHDISLDAEFYRRRGKDFQRHDFSEDMPAKARELWTGPAAKAAGIIFLDEGVHNFTLKSGAKLAVYASPFQPEFYDWAFPYKRNEDRFNSFDATCHTQGGTKCIAENPIPDFPRIDVAMTHGPPFGILDTTARGEAVGCPHLLRAIARARPRLHCFGHIHELRILPSSLQLCIWRPLTHCRARGAKLISWETDVKAHESAVKAIKDVVQLQDPLNDSPNEHASYVDATSQADEHFTFGQATLMVNASIMNLRYRPTQAPWVVDLALVSS